MSMNRERHIASCRITDRPKTTTKADTAVEANIVKFGATNSIVPCKTNVPLVNAVPSANGSVQKSIAWAKKHPYIRPQEPLDLTEQSLCAMFANMSLDETPGRKWKSNVRLNGWNEPTNEEPATKHVRSGGSMWVLTKEMLARLYTTLAASKSSANKDDWPLPKETALQMLSSVRSVSDTTEYNTTETSSSAMETASVQKRRVRFARCASDTEEETEEEESSIEVAPIRKRNRRTGGRELSAVGGSTPQQHEKPMSTGRTDEKEEEVVIAQEEISSPRKREELSAEGGPNAGDNEPFPKRRKITTDNAKPTTLTRHACSPQKRKEQFPDDDSNSEADEPIQKRCKLVTEEMTQTAKTTPTAKEERSMLKRKRVDEGDTTNHFMCSIRIRDEEGPSPKRARLDKKK